MSVTVLMMMTPGLANKCYKKATVMLTMMVRD